MASTTVTCARLSKSSNSRFRRYALSAAVALIQTTDAKTVAEGAAITSQDFHGFEGGRLLASRTKSVPLPAPAAPENNLDDLFDPLGVLSSAIVTHPPLLQFFLLKTRI
jgi:hypothetical protein